MSRADKRRIGATRWAAPLRGAQAPTALAALRERSAVQEFHPPAVFLGEHRHPLAIEARRQRIGRQTGEVAGKIITLALREGPLKPIFRLGTVQAYEFERLPLRPRTLVARHLRDRRQQRLGHAFGLGATKSRDDYTDLGRPAAERISHQSACERQ